VSWEQFCEMVSERFDRDQHELLLRKLYSIKQTSSVTDYVTTFTTLVDQLTAYATSVDPIFFVTRFIDGLKPEIKVVVIVQRPKNLDTACTLVMLQEEAGGYPDPVRSAPSSHYKNVQALRNAHPLPPPPPKADKQDSVQAMPVSASSSSDAVSKLSALKQYRKALGLCYKCGAKWSKDHRCPPEVLHAVHDLWECFSHASDVSDANLMEPQIPEEHLCLAISKAAISGAPAPKTI